MEICLSHMTALRWYSQNPNPRAGARPCRATNVPGKPPTAYTAQRILRVIGYNSPIDVLISNPNGNHASRQVKTHVTALNYPEGSFVPIFKIGKTQVFATSPELTLLLISRSKPIDEIAYLGTLLCSNYRLNGNTSIGITQRGKGDCPPTNHARISLYTTENKDLPNATKLTKALPYILDNSKSPMESGIALTLALPVRHGGFNLGIPELNASVSLPQARNALGAAKRQTRYPDIMFASGTNGERRVGIDYDSAAVHARISSFGKDAERRNQIATFGSFTHLVMTPEQALEFNSFRRTADFARRALGLRPQPQLRKSAADADSQRILEQAWNRQFALWAKFVCHGGPQDLK